MSRRKRKSEDREKVSARLTPDSRRAIAAICCFFAVVFLFLAGINNAGSLGRMIFRYLSGLFGVGYFLLPISFFLLSLSLLRPWHTYLYSNSILSSTVLVISGLGIIETLFREKSGGIIGYTVVNLLTKLFDTTATLLFLASLFLIAMIILFDKHLTLEWSLFGKRLFGAGTEDNNSHEPEIIGETQGKEVGSEDSQKTSDKNTVHDKQEVAFDQSKPKRDTDTDDIQAQFQVSRSRRKKYSPPPLEILEKDSGKPSVGDLKANANIIKRTLANFGINVEMDEISIGPTVTRYALKPAEGVKLSRIVGLQDNLALALAAHPLRIEAPIPGKSLVGIEIPNSVKSIVGLGTLVSSRDFLDSSHPLFVSLGRGVSGNLVFANLAKAPHMLLAGSTGSGKSVAIHSTIVSLLYRNSPEMLRFALIDPKRVELTLYNSIPHLLTPVVTDAKKAILVLKWLIKEMERRYGVLESHAARDIQSYHASLTQNNEKHDDTMPYIVVVIDELADIMSAYPRELEASVVRLAQMSRAIGIHLILSTQRPSVEVITGLIKANIPTRIALQVPSQIDSRTILDMPGAEKLLGAGDMLYLSGERGKPERVQSAYISEQEVKKVSKYLRDRAEELPEELVLTTLDDQMLQNGATSATIFDSDENANDDPLYEEAKDLVIKTGKASTSYLQRRFKIGYARAARLIDILEEHGVVGPGEGAKPREIYMKEGATQAILSSEAEEHSSYGSEEA